MPALEVLPANLTSGLDRLSGRVRWLAVCRGFGLTAVVLATSVLLSLLVDMLVDAPLSLRYGLLGAVGISTGLSAWAFIWRPLVKRHTLPELARLVEVAHPELNEALLSTVEFMSDDEPESWKGSALMREWLVEETQTRLADLQVPDAAPTQPMRRAMIAGGMAVALLVLPGFMSSSYRQLLQRFAAPWQNLARVSNLYFEVPNGDRTVARGSDVELRAVPHWRLFKSKLPEIVRLDWQATADRKVHDQRRMEFDAATGNYVTTVPHVFQGFGFSVRESNAQSRQYAVNVVDAPSIASVSLAMVPPVYTRRPPQKIDGVTGKIPVFEHSALTLKVKFNKPVQSAEWLWKGDKPGEPGAIPSGPLPLSKDRLEAEIKWSAEAAGVFAMRLVDEYKLENPTEPERLLELVIDQPPKLEVSGDPQAVEAKPDDVVPVEVTATDDVGIAALELHYEFPDGRKGKVDGPALEPSSPKVEHRFRLDLAAISAKDGETLTWRVRAADGRPAPGPQEVWSEPRVILVSNKAKPPGSSDLELEQKALKEELAALQKAVQAGVEQVAALEKAADSAGRQNEPFERDDELPKAARQQEATAEQAELMAERLAEHPLFGNLAEETRGVGKQELPEAAKKIDAAKPMKDLGRKRNQLGEARATLEQAAKHLAEVSQKFDKLAALEQELLELNRLADQAGDLATELTNLQHRREEFEKELQNTQEPLPEDERVARQQSLDDEAQALEEKRQELTNKLSDLLKRNPELVEAARQSQRDRLAELSRQARELAEPEDLLAKALAEQAKQQAERAAPLAEQQQELAHKAEALQKETAEQAKRTQAKPLDPAALQEAVDNLKKGNLGAASAAQEAAAKELEQLAEALQKNESLSSDPHAAAEELAKRQAELQQKIAEAEENAPPEESAEQRAEHLRPLAVEQAALQAGVAQLDAPASAREKQQQALNQSAEALDKLLAGEAQQAAAASKQAESALDDLAAAIPPTAQRREQAAQKVAELRQQQEQLRKDAAAADPQNKEAQESLVKRQEQIARDAAAIDPVDAQRELEQAVQRSTQAATDLQQPDEAKAKQSQAEAEQALAKLQKRLEGHSVDEDVANLQKQQEALAKAANEGLSQPESPERSETLKSLAEQVQALAKSAAALDLPASGPQQQAARQALETAASKLGENSAGPKPENADSAKQAVEAASQALNALAQAARGSQPQAPAEGQPENDSSPEGQHGEPSSPGSPQQQAAAAAAKAAADLAQKQDAVRQETEKKAAEKPQATPQELAEHLDDLADQQEQLTQAANELPKSVAPLERAEALQKLAEAQSALERGAATEAQTAQKDAADSLREVQEQAEAMASEPPANSPAQAQQARELAQAQRDLQQQVDAARQEAAKAQAEASQPPMSSPEGQAPATATTEEPAQPASPQSTPAQPSPQQQRAEAAQALAEKLDRAAESLGSQPLDDQPASKSSEAAKQSASKASEQLSEAAQATQQGNPEEAAAASEQATKSLRQAAEEAATGAGKSPTKTPDVPPQVADDVTDALDQLREAQEKLEASRQTQSDNATGQKPPANSGEPATAGEPGMAEKPGAAERSSASADGAKPQAAPSGMEPGSMPGEGQSPSTSPSGGEGQGTGQPDQGGAEGMKPRQSGQPGQGQPGQGQPGQGQPGQGQPGQQGQPARMGSGKPTGQAQPAPADPLAEAAETLRQASESLQKAAQRSQRRGGTQPAPASADGKPSSQPGGGGVASGEPQPADMQQLEAAVKKSTGRRWGELPGELQTEILQAAAKKPSSDYARLIKLYFKEIAKTQKVPAAGTEK